MNQIFQALKNKQSIIKVVHMTQALYSKSSEVIWQLHVRKQEANLVLVQLMRKVAKTDSWESELFNESVDPVHKSSLNDSFKLSCDLRKLNAWVIRITLMIFEIWKIISTFVVFVWKRATRAFFKIFPSVFYGRKKIKQVWNEGKWWQNFHYGVNTLIKCFQSISTPAESFEGLQCHWPEVLLTWGWVKDRPPAVLQDGEESKTDEP